MKRLIAAIDNSAAARPVLGMARALAPMLSAAVEAVHVTEDGDRTARAVADSFGLPLLTLSGDPLEAIAELAADDEVVAVAVGTRGLPRRHKGVGHLSLALADRINKPVLAVPPEACPPERLGTVLIAVEGTAAKAPGLERAIDFAVGADLDLVVVHVDDEDSIPSFCDQTQHETEAYTREFLARYCPGARGARLELRVGVPAEEIVAAIASEAAEMLALGWPQGADGTRGAVAREVLDRSQVPVLLIAVP